MENKKHYFPDSLKTEKINRAPLDILYDACSNHWWLETNITTQKKEIDVWLVLESGKKISFEEKCHSNDHNFKGEMLFELHSLNNNGSLRAYGWATKPMHSDYIVDFCFATKTFYIYDTKKMMAQIREWYNTNSFPSDSYCPRPADNTEYKTHNIKINRKHLEPYLKASGLIGETQVEKYNKVK